MHKYHTIYFVFSTKLETNYESLSNNHHPPTSTPSGTSSSGGGGPQNENEASKEVKSEAESVNSTVKPIHNYPDYYQQHYGNPHNDLSSAFINCKQSADAFNRSSVVNNHHPTQSASSAPPCSARPSNSNSKSNKNRPNSGNLL